MSLFPLTLPQSVSGGLAIGSKLLSYLNSPSISTGPIGTPLRASVRLDIEKYEEHGQAEISSLLLLDVENGGKSFISDNIAPHPRSWSLSGYLSDPTEILGNAFSQFGGEAALTSSALGSIFSSFPYQLTNYILNVQAAVLWNAFYSRELVDFYDRNRKKWSVGISDMTISVDPVIRNKLRFNLALKEIKLYSSLSNITLDNVWTSGVGLGNTNFTELAAGSLANPLGAIFGT